MYSSGETGGTIMALSVKNFSMVHSVREELGVTIKDLAIFSKGRQMGTNGCAANNGGCEDLCFWNGTVVNCVCAHGKLGSDKKSCECNTLELNIFTHQYIVSLLDDEQVF